jgi:integrase
MAKLASQSKPVAAPMGQGAGEGVCLDQALAVPDPFELWQQSVLSLNEMTLISAKKYRPLWNAWCLWLLERNSHWSQANATIIELFLQGPAPGTGVARRRAINPERMSSYTKQRYWRLLRGVYASATRHALVASNPALDLQDAKRPSIQSSDRQSQILEPPVFERLLQPLTLTTVFNVKTEDDWWHVRDRAIVAVLVSTGITSGELLALRGQDVALFDPKRRRVPPVLLITGDSPQLVVDVMQTDDTVERSLAVLSTLQPLVQAWMDRRRALLLERCVRTVALSARDQFLQEHDLDGPFFVARRARQGGVIFPAMEPVSLYYTVSQGFKGLHRLMGHATSETDSAAPYVAKGPAVIRNSVIRYWIDALGVDRAVQLAGLKNVQSLRLGA